MEQIVGVTGMKSPQDVLAYWLDELGPEGWYAGGDALDAEIQRLISERATLAFEVGESKEDSPHAALPGLVCAPDARRKSPCRTTEHG